MIINTLPFYVILNRTNDMFLHQSYTKDDIVFTYDITKAMTFTSEYLAKNSIDVIGNHFKIVTLTSITVEEAK